MFFSRSRSTFLETRIPISYKITIGMATIICDITSGGVIAADKINTPTIACFRYFFKNADDKTPNFVNKCATTGSKKSKPE